MPHPTYTGRALTACNLRYKGADAGAQSRSERIGGVHLHGLFTSDEYRRAWMARLGAAASPDLDFDADLEEALDEVASAIEAAVDVEALFAAAR